MRLFLSSENFGRYPQVLRDLAGENRRVAYIGNAKDYISAQDRAAKVAEHRAQFEGLGFTFVEIDLRDYFQAGVPKDILDGFGLVWCSGGNTFLLRAAMERSGFDKVLTEKVRTGEVAYGGSSAGSIVVGPTLRGTEHGDDPGAVAATYGSEVIWRGLGLVEFVVIPHWGSDWFGADAERMEQAIAADKNAARYMKLMDGQVLFVRDGKEELLS